MSAMLERIGYVDALIARETPAGLELIDGHLRRELSADAEVPVLVLDLNDAEAAEVLLTLDPMTGLAQADNKLLEQLVKDASNDETFKALFAELTHADAQGNAFTISPALNYKPQMQLTVTIESEEEAKTLYDRLKEEGYQCRLLML